MSRPLTDARPAQEIHDVLATERRGRYRLMLQVGGVLAIQASSTIAMVWSCRKRQQGNPEG